MYSDYIYFYLRINCINLKKLIKWPIVEPCVGRVAETLVFFHYLRRLLAVVASLIKEVSGTGPSIRMR